jgi:hypothetical protein
MKNYPILFLLMLCAAVPSFAEGTASYTPESSSSSEIFASKIVKIYSFQDGDISYIAYVVVWKDHEIIVSPLPEFVADSHFKVGDTIRCQMRQAHRRIGDQDMASVTFSIVLSPAQEAQHFEAIRADIESRRLARISGMSVATPQSLDKEPQKPNKAPVPTTTVVTPPAGQETRQP